MRTTLKDDNQHPTIWQPTPASTWQFGDRTWPAPNNQVLPKAPISYLDLSGASLMELTSDHRESLVTDYQMLPKAI